MARLAVPGASAALALAERGSLDLDAPVESLLKSWKAPERPFRTPLTVRRMLSHRAGLSMHGVPIEESRAPGLDNRAEPEATHDGR